MMAEAGAARHPVLTPEELRALMHRSPWRPTLGILRVYSLLMAVIAVAVWQGGAWLVPAFCVIAALQHALSILQHEAVHGLISPHKRRNDLIGTWLLSYPIGFTMGYRVTHFAHHRHLGNDAQDPDAANYAAFPLPPRAFATRVIRAFSGIGAILQFVRGGTRSHGTATKDLAGMALVQIILFSFFLWAGAPWLYVVLWALPLVTAAKGFTYLRNVAEHLTRPGASMGDGRLRTFRSSLVERFFLAPFNFHIHAEHHWYPQVPYYRLPALRRALAMHPTYTTDAEQCPSYLAVLREAARGQQPIAL